MEKLLTNKVDHLKTTSYSRFFDDTVDRDINLCKPNEYYVSPRVKDKLDPLATAMRSVGHSRKNSMFQTMNQLPDMDPANSTKVQMMAEMKLQDKLWKMNAAYHHHFHNAIVGHEDPDVRYNAKWLEKGPAQPHNYMADESLQNEIGSVRVGAFRRGQGGLFSKLPVPFDALNAKKLYVEAEKKKKLLEIGVDFGS